MMPEVSFNLSAFWGPRRETPAALAQRWLTTVRQLRALDPALADWYRGVDGRGVPVPLEAGTVEAAIAADADGHGLPLQRQERHRRPRTARLRLQHERG